jgi:hypothetical protein
MKSIHSLSIDRILEILESGKSVFQSIEKDSTGIRGTYVSKRYPHSIGNMSAVETETLYDVIGAGRQIKDEERGEKVLIDDLASDFKESSDAQDIDNKGRDRFKPTVQGELAASYSGLSSAYSNQKQSAVPAFHMPWEFRTLQSLKDEVQNIQKRFGVPAIGVGVLNFEQTDFFVVGSRKKGNPTHAAQTDLVQVWGISDQMAATYLRVSLSEDCSSGPRPSM